MKTSPRMKFALTTLAVLFSAFSAYATDYTWANGALGGIWNTSSYWTPSSGTPSSASDNATVTMTASGKVIDVQGATTVGNLSIGLNSLNSLSIDGAAIGTQSLAINGTLTKTNTTGVVNFIDNSASGSTSYQFSVAVGTLNMTGPGQFNFGIATRKLQGFAANSGVTMSNNDGVNGAIIGFNVLTDYSLGSLTFSGAGAKTINLINTTSFAAYSRTITVSGINQTSGTAATINGSATGSNTGSASTLNINTATGQSYSTINVFSNGAAGSTLAITKQGSGSQTLAGTNTYTGATTISAGKLTIASTGTINSTSGVSIGAGEFNYNSSTALTPSITFSGTGGTLSGSGTVGALTLTSGNTLSPGNSPGTLTTGNEVWNGGATYVWEINNATGTQGTNWDFISSTGSLDISALSTSSKFNVNIVGLTAGDVSGAVPNWVDGTASWKIASFTSITGTFTSDRFNVDAGGFTNHNSAAGVFTITNIGNDLYVTYSIPEPSTYAAFAGALALVGTVGCRRRRKHGLTAF